jgi:translation initiation factor 2 beta subunit (eIF-2beta)/eIF-5
MNAFYRYEISNALIKIESGKTIILNLSQIANEINRDVRSLLSFMGKTIDARTHISRKGDISISGQHTAEVIDDLINSYFDKYVRCGTCGNPETTISAVDDKPRRRLSNLSPRKKNDELRIECKVCGSVFVHN